MFSILLNEQNELIVTHRERIIQRSKLVDSFVIYVPEEYKDIDMSDFQPYIEYVLPVSKRYRTEKLEMVESEEKEGFLECVLPFDTHLTSEAGDIEFQLSFIKVEMDTEGKTIQYVRKTSTCDITIIPIAAWSDIVPDEALSAVDQAFIKAEAMMKELNDLAQSINDNKADNIAINDNGSLQLKSKGDFIGDEVDVAIPGVEDDFDGNTDGVIDLDTIYL